RRPARSSALACAAATHHSHAAAGFLATVGLPADSHLSVGGTMKRLMLLAGFVFLAVALTWGQSTTQKEPSGQPQGSAGSTASSGQQQPQQPSTQSGNTQTPNSNTGSSSSSSTSSGNDNAGGNAGQASS